MLRVCWDFVSFNKSAVGWKYFRALGAQGAPAEEFQVGGKCAEKYVCFMGDCQIYQDITRNQGFPESE